MDNESKKALKAFGTISDYCSARNGDCSKCVFSRLESEETICLFQDAVWMGDNRISGITKSDILRRAGMK